MSLVIETAGLCKRYRGRLVVDHLDLQVPPGEVFGFLGPNGAGKSTTLKMLLGLVWPSAGRVQVLGGSPLDPLVRTRLGFLPEQFRFQTWMTAQEFLHFHGRLAGLKGTELRQRVPAVLERVGLGGRGQETLSRYSKGMLQRCGLAGALLAHPQLVFLDEPTSALDPLGRVEVRELIEQLRGEGVTVFLNSHLLSEVEQVCDRVAFIQQGRVLRQGRLSELRGEGQGEGLRLELRLGHLPDGLLDTLSQYGQVREVCPAKENGQVELRLWLPDETRLPQLSAAVLASGAELYALIPHRSDLETIFLELLDPAGGHRA